MVRQALLNLAKGERREEYQAWKGRAIHAENRAMGLEARAAIAENRERVQRGRHAREMADLRAQVILTNEPQKHTIDAGGLAPAAIDSDRIPTS